MVPRLAAQIEARQIADHRVVGRVRRRRPSARSTVRNQSGACEGGCFSKNDDSPSTPSGKRFIVSGRSQRWPSMTGAIRA